MHLNFAEKTVQSDKTLGINAIKEKQMCPVKEDKKTATGLVFENVFSLYFQTTHTVSSEFVGAFIYCSCFYFFFNRF